MVTDKDINAWIDGNASALVLREYLKPVEGDQTPFFPPTFAGTGQDGSDYCIDTMRDGTMVCLVDTVGSQANRMEPVFTQQPYDALIPQITIKAHNETINLCEVGHRVADAFLKNSSISDLIDSALNALKKEKDATKLAKVAPTSLVFGVWDSRNTQVKMPRIISSVIRAYDVDVLSRSAQYFPPVNYREENILGESKDKKETNARSELGYNEIPSTNTHGGIISHGPIQRDTVVNFAALRKIRASDEIQTKTLQAYILGLTLVAALSIREWNLRQGCLLTIDPDREKPTWNLVYPNGDRNKVDLSQKTVLKYAQDVANRFGIGENKKASFETEKASKAIKEKIKKK